MEPWNFTPRNLTKRNENEYLQKDKHMNTLGNIIFSRPKLDTIQISIKWWKINNM